jgi:hypothetical protein
MQAGNLRYMGRMKFVQTLIIVFLSFFTRAQIGMGSWKLHMESSKAIDIVSDGTRLFVAFENGLYLYNPSAEENEIKTAVNGLSDIEISCLYHDSIQDAVYIGYKNGNIDKWKNGTITNIPAIALAQLATSKTINRFLRNGDYIYAANDFSIVLIDAQKDEIKDTYYPSNGLEPIVDVELTQDSIFALTPSQVWKGLRSNPALPDYSQWERDLRFPFQSTLQYKELSQINGLFYVLLTDEGYGADNVLKLENNVLTSIISPDESIEIYSIQDLSNQLFVGTDGGFMKFSAQGTWLSSYNASLIDRWLSTARVCQLGASFWSADFSWGLLEHANEFTCKYYQVNGPANRDFYKMDWQNGVLAIASGRLQDEIAPAFTRNGIHIYEDQQWRFHNSPKVSNWDASKMWDFIAIAVNPKNPKEIAASTYSYQPLTLLNETDTLVFDATNSDLAPVSIGNGWYLVSDLKFDQRGQLWCLNGYTDDALKMRKPDGTWQSYYAGPGISNKMTGKMCIDFNNNIWMATYSNGLVGYKHQGTYDDHSDDQYVQLTKGELNGNLPSNHITALAADFDGEIWIGTETGFAVLYNSDAAFDANPGDYNAQRIKIKFEQNGEYVLGEAYITDIEVDGGNRKWMATANAGILLLSPDGTEIIEQHTTDNSPLISNTIYDLQLDQTTGELFIVTDKGLVSYRTNASYEDPSYESLTVFPNPVRPNYFGPVTIQGIRYDSDVRITDAGGNLIYTTQSNGGTATWNGQNLAGEKVPTGVYFIWTATNYEGRDRKVAKVMVIR